MESADSESEAVADADASPEWPVLSALMPRSVPPSPLAVAPLSLTRLSQSTEAVAAEAEAEGAVVVHAA